MTNTDMICDHRDRFFSATTDENRNHEVVVIDRDDTDQIVVICVQQDGTELTRAFPITALAAARRYAEREARMAGCDILE